MASQVKKARVGTAAAETSLSVAEKRAQRLIWVDCEMTGLNETDVLLEVRLLSSVALERALRVAVKVAVIVTEGDRELTVVEESESLVIHRPDSVLNKMGPWCRGTFAKNGLTEQVKASKLSADDVEVRHCCLCSSSCVEAKVRLRKSWWDW